MSSKSVADQIRALDEQRQKLLGQAKEDALRKARAAVDELNALGFSYVLESRRGRGSAGSRQGTRRISVDRACPICGFRTEPPHDGRAHRGQSNKKPFTAEELSALRMKKA